MQEPTQEMISFKLISLYDAEFTMFLYKVAIEKASEPSAPRTWDR